MNSVIIAAGGSGTRMNSAIPKQFISVSGKPLIVYTLSVFNDHKDIDEIIVACHEQYIDELKDWILFYGLNKVARIVPAGKSRQESVYNGLNAVSLKTKIVLIHDAARPLVTGSIIGENILAAELHGAVTTAVISDDTLVKSENGLFIDEPLSREMIYRIQTPQSFKYKIIKDAHEKNKYNPPAADDCGLVSDSGGKIAIVKGDKINFKITTEDDLSLFEKIINSK